MWQEITVAVIVTACAVHAGARYLPLAWRRHIVYALSRRGLGQARLAKWFKTESSCGSGCGSCGASSSASGAACGTSASSSSPPADTSASPKHRVIRLHVQR